MLRTLLLGAVGAVVAFGALSAQMTPKLPDAVSEPIVETVSRDDVASMGELHWIGQSFEEDVVILVRDVTLLGIGALVVGVSAVCINARRSIEAKAFSPRADHAPV